jgi:hypothetical protein
LFLASFRTYASSNRLPEDLQGSILGLWLAVTEAGFPPARFKLHCPAATRFANLRRYHRIQSNGWNSILGNSWAGWARHDRVVTPPLRSIDQNDSMATIFIITSHKHLPTQITCFAFLMIKL